MQPLVVKNSALAQNASLLGVDGATIDATSPMPDGSLAGITEAPGSTKGDQPPLINSELVSQAEIRDDTEPTNKKINETAEPTGDSNNVLQPKGTAAAAPGSSFLDRLENESKKDNDVLDSGQETPLRGPSSQQVGVTPSMETDETPLRNYKDATASGVGTVVAPGKAPITLDTILSEQQF